MQDDKLYNDTTTESILFIIYSAKLTHIYFKRVANILHLCFNHNNCYTISVLFDNNKKQNQPVDKKISFDFSIKNIR